MMQPIYTVQVAPQADRACLIDEPQRSDQELIARVCEREEAALGAIYDRYQRLIFTIALRITGDRVVAEEVVQDVFHAVWLSAGSFHPGASLPAWLAGIARHRAIDATRARTNRARERERLLVDHELTPVSSAADAMADDLILRETVRAALGTLLPAQRQVLDMIYYGGLTYEETASRLGAPLGTVKSRARQALLKLRGELNLALE
jgi:RNA polymerase sigma-70 factor (ECF subfamily)